MARRLTIMVVLLGVSLPWLTPFIAARDDSGLPPCCRRDGKHHCAMMAQLEEQRKQSAGLPSFRQVPEPCPYRSTLLVPPAPANYGTLPTATFLQMPAAQPLRLIPLPVEAPGIEAHSPHKRGPPDLL